VLKDYIPDANVTSIVTLPIDKELISELEFLTGPHSKVEEPRKERLKRLLKLPLGTYIAEDIYNWSNKIPSIFERKNGIDILKVTRLANPHANAVVINHDSKKIFYFEPHIGSKYDDIYDPVMNLLQPLNYEVLSTDTCPAGLQNVTGDGYCRIWSLFGTLLMVLNPDKNPRELLNYFIGQKMAVRQTLNIFLFYIYSKYNDFVEQQKPSDGKSIAEAVADRLWNQVLKIKPMMNQKAIYFYMLGASMTIVEELNEVVKNYENMKYSDLVIIDSASNYVDALESMLAALESGADEKEMSTNYFHMIRYHFDLDKYGKKIHKTYRKKQDYCTLF